MYPFYFVKLHDTFISLLGLEINQTQILDMCGQHPVFHEILFNFYLYEPCLLDNSINRDTSGLFSASCYVFWYLSFSIYLFWNWKYVSLLTKIAYLKFWVMTIKHVAFKDTFLVLELIRWKRKIKIIKTCFFMRRYYCYLLFYFFFVLE